MYYASLKPTKAASIAAHIVSLDIPMSVSRLRHLHAHNARALIRAFPCASRYTFRVI